MNPDFEQLTAIFRDVFQDNSLSITEDSSTQTIKNWDSVATIQLIIALEEAYGVRLKMSDVSSIQSVKDLLKIIPKGANPTLKPAEDNKPLKTSDTVKQCIRIALSGTSTTSFLRAELQKSAQKHGWELDIYESEFGCFRKDLLDPGSNLYKHKPQFIILHTNWRDLNLPPIADNAEASIQDTTDAWLQLWNNIAKASDASVLQYAFDQPQTPSEGQLGWLLKNGRTRMIDAINLSLAEQAPAHTYFLSSLQAKCTTWEDKRSWLSQRQHPHHSSLKTMSDTLIGTAKAILGQTKKVLILDLDNTLWGGLVGEDGVHGIELGPPSPVGEAFSSFQNYIQELKARGILLAVCSKNDEARAKSPFREHDSCPLKLDDFAAFHANWAPKSENIKSIAEQLNLGLDSMIFVDDNPAECAEVEQALPEVRSICIAGDPSEIVEKVHSSGAFESVQYSIEDSKRAESYKNKQARQKLKTQSHDYESYLNSLEMQLRHTTIGPAQINRITQLVNKTNQFNLSLRRRNQSELEGLVQSDLYYAKAFAYSDRFEDSGWVALALAKRKPEWELDTLIMSCRVFGRGIENAILNLLLQDAKQAGSRTLIAEYVPTGRNELVQAFLLKSGFELQSETENHIQYAIDIPKFKELPTHFHAVEALG